MNEIKIKCGDILSSKVIKKIIKRERRPNEQRALNEKSENDRGMKSNKNEELTLCESKIIDSFLLTITLYFMLLKSSKYTYHLNKSLN